jgi:two-component system, OmpR family, phosphate regulon sensor histidine kinase PhoR
MRLRAHHKLFASYSLLVAGVVAALIVGVEVTLRPSLSEQAAVDLGRELILGLEIYGSSPGADPDSLADHLGHLTGHRVTIIARDGTVLGDSDVPRGRLPELENHAGRPEFMEAVQVGSGTSIRWSPSVETEMLYAAAVATDGRVLRFAVGVEAIDLAIARVRRQILQVGIIALVVAGLFSLAFSVAITTPLRRMQAIATSMAGGDLGRRVRISRSDELGDLADALDRLADELQQRLSQLEAEREEMRALIDSMTEGVLAVNPDGTIRRANPAARAMFELGESVEGLAPEAVARRRPFMELVARVLQGEAIPPTELEHHGRHLLATAEPLPQGGAVLVFLDTTELRRLEGVRRDFVANASHELKTPLTVIRGNAETLMDEGLPPEIRRRFTERLRANADRLQAILDDLLDLSRIESGGWTPTTRPIHLPTIVEESWLEFQDAAGERQIEFRTVVPEDAARLEADPRALRQVFTNLFSNALRYTPEGGHVTVRSRKLDDDRIRVEVSDTGSGIAAPHLNPIFERFYRVDPARSRSDGGTGLGLSIVRHLVERHGGTVAAESELGRGTTILIELPSRASGDVSSSPPDSVDAG